MTLADWLQHISECHHKSIDMSLERAAEVAATLGVLPFHCPVFTVAGTNGKGSCVATITAILQAGGYRVGTYTSPHLLVFNERIAIAGQPVTDAELCAAFAAVDAARDNVSLTYFEFVTLAALVIFARAQLDAVVLEVGLGGRFDAVNIVPNDIAVITTVDFDHMAWLGDTREKIGFEKAGIFKEGRTVICAERDPPSSVLRVAQERNCRLWRLGVDDDVIQHDTYWTWRSQPEHRWPLPQLHQDNVAAAMVAVQHCSALPVATAQIAKAIANVRVPGRLQEFRSDIIEVLDVSHNPQSIANLAAYLARDPRRTVAVWSMLQDKDQQSSVAVIKPYIDAWYVAPIDAPRATTLPTLIAVMQQAGCTYHPVSDIPAAYALARQQLTVGERLVVFGSFHTVATVLETRIMYPAQI